MYVYVSIYILLPSVHNKSRAGRAVARIRLNALDLILSRGRLLRARQPRHKEGCAGSGAREQRRGWAHTGSPEQRGCGAADHGTRVHRQGASCMMWSSLQVVGPERRRLPRLVCVSCMCIILCYTYICIVLCYYRRLWYDLKPYVYADRYDFFFRQVFRYDMVMCI